MKTPAAVVVTLLVAFAVDALAGEPRSATNLLRNPGFETGDTAPEGWRMFPRAPEGIRYVWDDAKRHSGRRSACVEGTGRQFGMWQQIVAVEPGRVYVFWAHVAFGDIAPPGHCCLQLVFRNAKDDLLRMDLWPRHTGTREFALDFPAPLKVRAPDDAARVEVNLFLAGTGRAWFDDVFFGPAPTGQIVGRVTCKDQPVAGARVHVWGNPWGKTCEALTDADGKYVLNDIPVAFPRYVLLAAKSGYRSRPAGDVEVKDGGSTTVDLALEPGSDPDDLRVKFGTLTLQKFARGTFIPEDAVIPAEASGYPEAVRPYLKADEFIQSDHPDVVAKAKEIVASVPAEHRKDTRWVAWAVHEWVSKHIEHDGVFSVAGQGGLDQPFRDVTSGIWQTISDRGWCWGRNFLDWCYRPHELLKVNGGICVEHAWLVAALFRALNVPARASVGSHEFYAQRSMGDGAWIHGGTTAGRTSYREHGLVRNGFEGWGPEERFSVLSRPILHEDWNALNKGLWRERHPWHERYEATSAGREQALADLSKFAETGEAPRAGFLPPRRPREQEQEDMATQRRRPEPPPGDSYLIHYSDVTINLFNMGAQRTLDVRFPMVSAAATGTPEGINKFWTNHPECVKRTWVEEITNPPAVGAERWFHVEFDLTGLLNQGSQP